MQEKFRVTLCCPAPRADFVSGELHVDSELPEMEQYLAAGDAGDIVVYPEGFLRADHIADAAALAKKYGKWIVTGTDGAGDNHDLCVAVISPADGLVYSHKKTALTVGDVARGSTRGESIEAFATPFCAVGTILCYEVHFPEVARILALGGAQLFINTVGTGMWHEQQLYEWTTVAKARAIENRAFIVGCTHYCDPVPMMYAYGPDGRELALVTHERGSVTVEIDLSKITERDWLRDRAPALYGKLCEKQGETL
ncbi:MAG: carbon-nitrogen hydrolase family protein [Oscillospiraceae bacterium]|nr:carbon-nitrogen hydrolase family protein [Oscillospiraceae bacterium]